MPNVVPEASIKNRAGTRNYIPPYLWDVITFPAIDNCFWHNTSDVAFLFKSSFVEDKTLFIPQYIGMAGDVLVAQTVRTSLGIVFFQNISVSSPQ